MEDGGNECKSDCDHSAAVYRREHLDSSVAQPWTCWLSAIYIVHTLNFFLFCLGKSCGVDFVVVPCYLLAFLQLVSVFKQGRVSYPMSCEAEGSDSLKPFHLG